MSDNQANPTKGAETDLQKAAKSITGLLNPVAEEKKTDKINTPEKNKNRKNKILLNQQKRNLQQKINLWNRK